VAKGVRKLTRCVVFIFNTTTQAPIYAARRISIHGIKLCSMGNPALRRPTPIFTPAA
jgi:hypothetical protein